MKDIYIQLAYDTIKTYLEKEELPDLKTVDREILLRHNGCFVTLHDKNGALRGCIGTVKPLYKNLGGEIEANALAACKDDPRFSPVTLDELDNLKISVDILSEPEQVYSNDALDIKKFGIIVQAEGGRDGLLLPDIKGINSVEEQIAIARQKGEIKPDEQIALFRFMVERHEEK